MIQINVTLNRKMALAIILSVMSMMVIDTAIVKYIALTNNELATPVYVGIFITFTIVFVGTVIILLTVINSKDSNPVVVRGLAVKSYYLLITMTGLSLLGILVIFIIQPTLELKNYNTLALFAIIYVSHIISLLFLFLLVLTLSDWIRTKRSKILSFYTVAFALTAVAIITSLIYATNVLAYQPTTIRPYPIHVSVINLPRGELAIYFGPILDVMSIVSFVSVWVATSVLLNTYSKRLGKIKYWAIIAIPLIYFLFPFERSVADVFRPLIDASPALFGAVDILVFSATKQIGALVFSLAFLAASALITKNEMQKYMLISAIGIAILFGSIEIDTLLYATYPPFGLITTSFMPIGSYLVFSGITLSATLLARDKELRKEFYQTAMSELTLLKTIGVTEMEKEIIKSYKSIEKRNKASERKETRFEKDYVREILHDVVDDLDKDNVREILHEVLTELYTKSRPKSKT